MILAALTLVIWNDLGGSVSERLDQMQALGSTHVEIRGNCQSACTMYLGLPDVCVAPGAILGFHGPRTSIPGIPLPRREWDRVTMLMAREYPPQIARWFLKIARYHISDMLMITGREAIRTGARPCD